MCVYRKRILDFTSDQEFNLTPSLPPNGNQTFFKTAGACFWSLYVSGFQFGGVRGVKLIFIEYLLCAKRMVGCLALIITFLKQLCEVGLLIPHFEDKKLSLRKAQLILPRF